MNNDLKTAYQKLNIQDKRNELSNLLLKTEELANQMLNNKELQEYSSVKNYSPKEHGKLTEEEMLTFIFEDVWTIKNKILAINVLKK